MAHDPLIAWLNDAYAMEQGMIPVLQNHSSDARNEQMPEAAARMERHVAETSTHAERIEQCLRELGTAPSVVKSTLSSVMGTVQSFSTGIFQDEAIKNTLADYGAEQFEVACYRALIAGARQLGQNRIAEICELNLKEDQAMADFLRDQIPAVVSHTLATT